MSRGSVGNWVKIALVLLLFFLIAAGRAILEVQQKEAAGPQRTTTYSAAPGGYKALYMWLKALGVPIQRWERAFQRLPPAARVLLIAEPESIPSKEELNVLKRWVRQGGALVLAAKPSNPVLKGFGLKPEASRSSGAAEEGLLVQPGPYTAGVKTIRPWQGPGISSSRPEVVFHIRDSEKKLLAVQLLGNGRVIALGAPELFSNSELREGDHARLALNLLLCHLGDGLLLVDEYHHGYGRVGTILQHFIHSGAVAPLLQAMLLLLLSWAVWGRRFGLARPIGPVERRSSMEHVRSMAQLFKKARARGLALGAMMRWIEEEAKKDLVYTDRALQSALRTAHGRRQDRTLSDRELLSSVRGLYRTLEGARTRAATAQND